MDSGSGRVNPTKIPGESKLLRVERPRDGNFGVWDLLLDTVVILEVSDRQIRKLLMQPWDKPIRSSPELETMMQDD